MQLKAMPLALVLITSYAIATPAFAETAPEDAYDYRHSVMESLGSHTRAFFLIFAGKVDQRDQMTHFCILLESGHVTASTALGQLNGFNGKNHFYRGNRELWAAFFVPSIRSRSCRIEYCVGITAGDCSKANKSMPGTGYQIRKTRKSPQAGLAGTTAFL